MSGSALSPWAIARDTDIYAKQLAQSLNCPLQVSHSYFGSEQKAFH